MSPQNHVVWYVEVVLQIPFLLGGRFPCLVSVPPNPFCGRWQVFGRSSFNIRIFGSVPSKSAF